MNRPKRTNRNPALRALAMALALQTALPATARSQSVPPTPEPPVFGVSAATVMLDVVVRDGRGRLVRDLKAEDFEVYEDKVRQTVDSFRIVDNTQVAPATAPATEAAEAAPAPAAAPPAAPPAEAAQATAPAVVAFVFDRLSAEARKKALKAALTYTDRGYAQGDLVGIFGIDLALRTLQPFTTDLESVRAGLQLAAAQANTQFASHREEDRRQMERVARSEAALEGMQAGGEGGSNTASILASEIAVDQAYLSMNRAFDALERDQQGFATTHGLLAVVTGLKAIPGRKTIVFFSEGIAIPANVQEQFHSVIASANRANVSIYAIDAGGLRVESGTREARDELMLSSQRRLRQEENAGRGLPTREALNRGMERNEDMLRLNPESGLGQLASETGGFLVRDTNDAREDFGRISEEMRFHYVLAYAPTNDKMDGSYRTIGVRLRRSGLRVQTRKGYLAIKPAEYIMPVRDYEAPALAQLDRQPRPDAFPVHAAAYSFPEDTRPGLAPVMVQIPGGTMTWSTEEKGGAPARAEFAVLVKIRDGGGREVDRMSQEYRLNAPADKLEAARRGDVLFYREADLPVGRYTAEAVAYDALAKTASVRSFPLEISAADPERLRLSSLMLVSRAEQLRPEEQKDTRNPLHFGEVILYPNLGTPLHKSQVPAVGFFFAVYGKSVASAKSATIEIARGGQVVARTTSDLPAPDASGRIQHAGAVPLKGFAPGEYRLKVSVADGRSVESRDASFTVAE